MASVAPTQRVLDRVPRFDERSRQYPIRALMGTAQPRSYTWSCPVWLDQGTEGACVGHGWAHENAARPVARPSSSELAFALYREAQKLDQWPGEDYSGTSVLAGAKAMQARGLLQEYRWAFGLDDALVAISRHGPAVIGVTWYEGMFNTNSEGFIRPTGRRVGGHCVMVHGVNVRSRTVRLRNSWGRGWGVNGDALLAWEDLAFLLKNKGEVCVPVRR